MFSNLHYFMANVRDRMIQKPRITLVMARNEAFDGMSRSQLLKLRDSCYGLANDITVYLCQLDAEPPEDSLEAFNDENNDEN